ncbi:hypothetical protein BZA05DRAFT_149569 [Tricharina praecox]|uniref:uncharacterized protein n=1 Tax=Tricharina praecox TaxID=43433 RepID=UPI00221FB571|nr:uncharacterized protein BZA05DRAFT_149569 [Tricharina praecox]KAI5845400.1 hypothetical protein BZA05DRAFT_149569 [Tricharina praecox]
MSKPFPFIDAAGSTPSPPKTAPPAPVVGCEKLLQRITADIASAGAATMIIAPLICLIDRSIMENASGKTSSVLESAKLQFKTIVTKPHRFIFSKPFALIYMTYFGTYMTANTIDTVSAVRTGGDIKVVTSGTEKFLATSTANMSLGLIKDRNFARLFGTGTPRPVPLPSFVLFSIRDAMTIMFSFNVPSRVSHLMPNASPFMSSESIAQFVSPVSCQVLSTPLHLFGLDLYNRGRNVTWRERLQMIKVNYSQSTLARMCRIVPAFGFGGVTNTKVRRSLLEKIEDSA